MRVVSALMPAQRRRHETWRWIGLGLVVAGVLLSVVGTGAVGVLAVVPIVTGGALFTVSSVRWWDLAVDTARSFQAGQAVRTPQLEDRATVSVAAVSSARRSAVVLGATLSVLALGAGVAGSVLPVLGSTQADGASPAAVDAPAPLSTATPTTAPARGAHGSPVGPFAVADGTVQIGQVDDEEAWSAVCGAVSSDSGCSAWAVVAANECDLDVTIGFADTQHGATTRTELRSVRVRPGTPVFVASVGDELWSGIESEPADRNRRSTSTSPPGSRPTTPKPPPRSAGSSAASASTCSRAATARRPTCSSPCTTTTAVWGTRTTSWSPSSSTRARPSLHGQAGPRASKAMPSSPGSRAASVGSTTPPRTQSAM
ncbi:hypothetical protein BIU92_07250 [Curtobacterium sp. MCBA15_003]|nr:hypothetical protein BIU92_07250 [Curtobacterium sp. MCBA15_003]OII29288.1 hypothetical protein BIU94_12750 [Curtobacterium sp. MMLR14_006]